MAESIEHLGRQEIPLRPHLDQRAEPKEGQALKDLLGEWIAAAKEHLQQTPWELQNVHPLTKENISARGFVERGLDQLLILTTQVLKNPQKFSSQKGSLEEVTSHVPALLGGGPERGSRTQVTAYLQRKTEARLLPSDGSWREQVFVNALEPREDSRDDFALIVRNSIRGIETAIEEAARSSSPQEASETQKRLTETRARLEAVPLGVIEIAHNQVRWWQGKAEGRRTAGLRITLFYHRTTVELIEYFTGRPATIDGPFFIYEREPGKMTPEQIFDLAGELAGIASVKVGEMGRGGVINFGDRKKRR